MSVGTEGTLDNIKDGSQDVDCKPGPYCCEVETKEFRLTFCYSHYFDYLN